MNTANSIGIIPFAIRDVPFHDVDLRICQINASMYKSMANVLEQCPPGLVVAACCINAKDALIHWFNGSKVPSHISDHQSVKVVYLEKMVLKLVWHVVIP